MNGQNVQSDEAWSKVSKSMEDAVKTLEQVVDDNKEAFQEILWGVFINWAIREPEMWENYARETGKRNPACGYDALEDEALCHNIESGLVKTQPGRMAPPGYFFARRQI